MPLQRQCCLEPPLYSLVESCSTQFRSIADNAPTSVSLALSEDQRPMVVSQVVFDTFSFIKTLKFHYKIIIDLELT